MVPSFGLLNSVGVLQAWLANNQLKDYSGSSIGWIFGVFNFFVLRQYRLVRSIPVDYEHQSVDYSGPIFDTHGLKYISSRDA